MQNTQPAVGVFDRDGECVGLGVLEGDSHACEEERRHEERVGRMPKHQCVSDALDGSTHDQSPARSQPRADMDIGERCHDPAGKVDQVDEGDLQEIDLVGGLHVGNEDSRGRIWGQLGRMSDDLQSRWYLPFMPPPMIARLVLRIFPNTERASFLSKNDDSGEGLPEASTLPAFSC